MKTALTALVALGLSLAAVNTASAGFGPKDIRPQETGAAGFGPRDLPIQDTSAGFGPQDLPVQSTMARSPWEAFGSSTGETK